MLRAIIFDCFGVLATDELLPFLREYFGTGTEQFSKAVELVRNVDSGKSSYEKMLQQLADMAGISFEAAKSRIEANVPDENLFGYIREELKAKYKIGFLSNSSKNWVNEIFQPEQVALFDAILLSYQVGYAKPDTRIYKDIAEELGVAVENCLMVDDQEKYCKGAERAGMHAVIYQGLSSLEEEMERLKF